MTQMRRTNTKFVTVHVAQASLPVPLSPSSVSETLIYSGDLNSALNCNKRTGVRLYLLQVFQEPHLMFSACSVWQFAEDCP